MRFTIHRWNDKLARDEVIVTDLHGRVLTDGEIDAMMNEALADPLVSRVECKDIVRFGMFKNPVEIL